MHITLLKCYTVNNIMVGSCSEMFLVKLGRVLEKLARVQFRCIKSQPAAKLRHLIA